MGYMYAPPPPTENVNKLFCSQITSSAILKPSLLNPKDSIAAVPLENELLLAFCILYWGPLGNALFVKQLEVRTQEVEVRT